MSPLRSLRSRSRRALGWRARVLADRLAPLGMDAGPKYQYVLNVSQQGRLQDKVAIVTGGGGSIGSAVCYRLAIEGAIVGVAGRNQAALEAAVEQVCGAGVDRARVVPLIMDVSDGTSVAAAIDSFVADHGRLDILVNSAGGSARDHVALLEDQDLSVIKDVIDVNLLGVMRCAKYAAPHLRQTHGTIINFGSVLGLGGQARYSDYAASKGGITALTKSLALELASDDVTVNTVTPGQVWRNSFDGAQARNTTKTALGRYGHAEEVAGLVAYLCSDEAAYITGVEIPIDGGRTLGLKGE